MLPFVSFGFSYSFRFGRFCAAVFYLLRFLCKHWAIPKDRFNRIIPQYFSNIARSPTVKLTIEGIAFACNLLPFRAQTVVTKNGNVYLTFTPFKQFAVHFTNLVRTKPFRHPGFGPGFG